MKHIVVGFLIFPILFAALGVGLFFGSYSVAAAQNPKEKTITAVFRKLKYILSTKK
jgi:F0F1-type ATP synthase membrane subunit c/vacuolar-type H+-ATPase subunit K